jgi:diadenosine tetraphosphate (Ap4A) HIT family hydrolase
MAEIHPQLKNDCVLLGRFDLCYLLLANDANYPWFIMVPDRDSIKEIYQLSKDDQMQLLSESSLLSEHIMQVFNGDKLNLAALGNQVPQLHIHHIVRYESDLAWPTPVWGKVAAKPYSENGLADLVSKLELSKLSGFEIAKEFV